MIEPKENQIINFQNISLDQSISLFQLGTEEL